MPLFARQSKDPSLRGVASEPRGQHLGSSSYEARIPQKKRQDDNSQKGLIPDRHSPRIAKTHFRQPDADSYFYPSPHHNEDVLSHTGSLSRGIAPLPHDREQEPKRHSTPTVSTTPHYPRERYSSLPEAQLSGSQRLPAHYADPNFDVSNASASIPRSPLEHPKIRAIGAIDIEPDRLARACGQGLIDFTFGNRPRSSSCATPRDADSSSPEWEDTDRAGRDHSQHRRAKSLHVSRNNSPLNPRALDVVQSEDAGADQRRLVHEPDAPLPPYFQMPEPRDVLRSLNRLLKTQKLRLEDYFEVDELLEAKEKEANEWRAVLERLDARDSDKSDEEKERRDQFRLFGAPLREVAVYGSTAAVLGNYRHCLPNVVYACVEELYRTGIYQHGLFRALPHRPRLVELVSRFDQLARSQSVSPSASALPSLRKASMPDVCALLSSYLNALPAPLLDRTFHNAMWSWCVRPSVTRDEEKRVKDLTSELDDDGCPNPPSRIWRRRSHSEPRVRSPPLPEVSKTPEELRKEEIERERPQITIAQHLLQLLPPENYSLLMYLCAFFTQIPLCPENGIQFEDIARIFGHSLLGGPSKNAARVLTVWLLNRWGRIAEGLSNGNGEKEQTRVRGDSHLQKRGDLEKFRQLSLPVDPLDRRPIAHEEDSHEHDVPSQLAGTGHVQMRFDKPVSSGRPYSASVSPQESSSTYVSTTSSESGDTGSSLLSRINPPDESYEHNNKYRRTFKTMDGALPIVEEYKDIRQSPHRMERQMTEGMVSYPHERHFSPADNINEMQRRVSQSDSDSNYSTGSDGFSPPEKIGLNNPDEAHSPAPVKVRKGPARAPMIVSSTSTQFQGLVLPSDLATSNRELHSARQRISELERELKRARTLPRSGTHHGVLQTDGVKRDQEAADPKYVAERAEDEDGAMVDMKKRLEVVLSERDRARRLARDFKKLIEGALEDIE
ncbi:hypothetical protein AcV7_006118 [Taiwanofungus camphoratus]|nr:hypothetical protein AcV7_006118 [Antrodia cinnamomea]